MTAVAEVPTPDDVPDDREIPTEHKGKLEPNYYCRAWNPRRKKYCRNKAGLRTEHNGTGRCKFHDGGGDTKVVHGMRRRYENVASARIRDLVKQHEDQPDPLNILPEIALVRGLLQDFIERAETDTELDVTNAVEFAERLSRMAERVVTMQSRNAITYDQLRRFLFATERVIEGEIRDNVADETVAARIIKRINNKIRGIRP